MSREGERRIGPEELFSGKAVSLRLVTSEDCTPEYVGWLQDPEVNRYLETRWSIQTLETVRDFVSSMVESPTSYLFAIVDSGSSQHIGNLKIGPINTNHGFADLSYFVGDKAFWGRGCATEAIGIAARIAFTRLGIRRLQAGLYESNVASARALEKAGFTLDARMARQLRGPNGLEDHLWYVRFSDVPEAEYPMPHG